MMGSRKLAVAVALALGCGFTSVACAKTVDMTSAENLGGITWSSAEYGSQIGESWQNPDHYQFGYDKATGTVIGGDITLAEDMTKVTPSTWGGTSKQSPYLFVTLDVKASDMPDFSVDTMNKVAAAVTAKVKPAEGLVHNYPFNYMVVRVVDDDGTVLRVNNITYSSDWSVTLNPSGGTYKTVLCNDSNNTEYDIKQVDTKYTSGTIPANTWFVGDADSRYSYIIAPDLSKESIKAAVRGAEKDLYVTNVLGASTTNTTLDVQATGTASEKVYGVYNDQKGLVRLTNATLNITAAGNGQSNVAYAGNNADYTSQIDIVSNSDYRNPCLTLTADGNVIEAGKNGVINLTSANSNLISTNGNLLYAHDGGSISVGETKNKYAGITSTVSDGKYLALAETGGQIDVGVIIEHLDEVDYDKVQVLKGLRNFSGDLKADADSSVNLGLSGTYTYSGDAEGNVGLYMDNGATWAGSALGDSVSVSLGDNAVWTVTGSGSQHVKSLKGAETSSKRAFVNVGTDNITIDKYSGNTTFTYQHDTEDASKILGGDVIITSAEPVKLLSEGVGDAKYQISETSSTVNLRTDTNGIDTTDDDAVNSVLDNLAKKLYYTAYTTGERNLSGKVELAEGLTSASVAKYYSNITFDEKTGQGQKEQELFKPYTSVLFGNVATDTKNGYGDIISGTPEEGNLKYTFDKDALIEVKLNKDPRSMAWGGLYCAAINNYGDKQYNSTAYATKGGPSYTLDMQGHDLTVDFSAFPTAGSTGGQPMWTAAAIGAYRDGTITIDNPGAISLKSTNNYYYGSVIRASTAAVGATGAHVVINNDNSKEHAVKIRGGIDTPGYTINWRAIEVTTQTGTTKDNGNSVTIKGLVDIDVSNCASLFARGNYATIDLGGGKITSNNYTAIWTAGKEALINLNMLKDEEGNVTGAGENYVQITGDVASSTPWYGYYGTINMGLTTADSFIKGRIYGLGNNNLYLQNGAVWNNDPQSSYNWSDGSSSVTNIASLVTNLYGGATADAAGNIYQKEAKDITIQNMTGYVNAYLGHEIADDGSISFDSLGNIVVDKATKTDGQNASMTLYTNRDGIDTGEKTEVVNALTALGKKLIYNEAIATEDNPDPEINLDGKVGIAEGLTASSVAIRLADLNFSSEDGKGELVESTIHTPDAYIPVVYGSSETAMMKGAKSAMASSALMWRAENNDLMKRMGDLRLDDGEAGIWAKYYGGKYEMDSQNTNLNLKYNAYQVGFDKEVGNNWKVGVAVSYNDGDSSYGTGKADLTGTSVGLYGTWNGSDGQYVDLIAKYTRIENEYDVTNDSGHKLKGDYKTWGTSISAEYGKRFESKSGFYFDPSVELTLGRINGKDYNAHSDYLSSVGVKKDMEVQQDAFNTFVGRLGFRVGQKLDNASYFAKLTVAHEFSGDFDTTFRAPGEPEGKTSIDFGDTWYEAQIGGSAKLSDNSMIYASFERSFGGDVDEKWRVDAGLRFSF